MFKTNRSWCEMLIILSASGVCLILALDYNLSILPFRGAYLFIYTCSLLISTTWITFLFLQHLLQNNKPFEYDIERNLALKSIYKTYIFLTKTCYKSVCNPASTELIPDVMNRTPNNQLEDAPDNKVFQRVHNKKCIKNIDERIEDLIKDIEVRFILKWYVHISQDPTFPLESKLLLDEIIRHFLQVVIDIDGRKLVYGCIIILLKHIKEFKRALKRNTKKNTAVENCYRYSHVGSQSDKAMEHFIYHLTANVLRQFINWELWNSLPCRSLVAILSRKFTTYMLSYISAPGHINYKIVQMCASDSTQANLKLDNYYFISLSDVDLSGGSFQLDKSITCTDMKEKNISAIKNEESNTPKMSPKRKTEPITPTNTNLQLNITSTNLKWKPTDSSSTANGLTNKSVENGELQSLQSKKTPTTIENNDTNDAVEKVDLRQKASEPVKIYESKSSTKTWRNSSDLECISLGQDLLAFQEFNDPDTQIQELIEKKLWKDSADPVDDEKANSMWDIPESWYGEEESMVDAVPEIVSSPTTNFQNYIKNTANTALKPIGDVTASTLHNMKELQQTTVNTVNNVVKQSSHATTTAIHKIENLQSSTGSSKKFIQTSQDEAAGMVEGILDFGMAGLRKGLRLTGLQENFPELSQKSKQEQARIASNKPMDIQKSKTTEAIKINDKDAKMLVDKMQKSTAKLIKTPHVASEDKIEQIHSSSESDESVWINPLTKESPSFDGDILLERTPDSVPSSSVLSDQKLKITDVTDSHKPIQTLIPEITEEIISVNSPDPEYEETEDFASTIAKLRTLLQQKSSESGFTTPSLSPMPPDENIKTPKEPIAGDIKVDGAMPSLYKFCARTATGVFQNTLNTIKTALPGNMAESQQVHVHYNTEDWTFVEEDASKNDFHSRMKKLLSERKAFCTVDTAYEAIDTLEVMDQPDTFWTAPVVPFEDELDELDVQVPITKAIIDIICELMSETNTCLLQESVVKALLLLIGNYSEEYITKQSDSLLHNINKCVGKLPEHITEDVLSMKLNEMVQICLDYFPSLIKISFGENSVETGIELFLNSFQSQRINQDVFMQIFELFASQLISACSQISPAFSA